MPDSNKPTDAALQQRWINIHTAALANNVKILKQALGGAAGPKLMAVVKANAYGHGAAGVAPILRDAGADAFGVTTLGEALELVDAGIDSRITPILIFAPLNDSRQMRVAVELGLHVTVCNRDQLFLALEEKSNNGGPARVHLKVDLGMGRLGLSPDEIDLQLFNLELREEEALAGIYMHFPIAAQQSIIPTEQQLNRFLRLCESLRSEGNSLGLRHAANSAASLRLPQARLDMVRIGTALYGQMPSEFVPKPAGLSADTFQVQARVVFVHELRKGDTVGYGSEFIAPGPMTAAVVPIGFADGFGVAPTSLYRGWRGVKQLIADRDPKRRPYVTIHGQRSPVLGRIAMQMIVVDVTNHTKQPVQTGDTADIPLRRLSASALLPRRFIP